MSALHPIADMCGATTDVRYWPKADITPIRHLLLLSTQSTRRRACHCSNALRLAASSSEL